MLWRPAYYVRSDAPELDIDNKGDITMNVNLCWEYSQNTNYWMMQSNNVDDIVKQLK